MAQLWPAARAHTVRTAPSTALSCAGSLPYLRILRKGFRISPTLARVWCSVWPECLAPPDPCSGAARRQTLPSAQVKHGCLHHRDATASSTTAPQLTQQPS